MKFGELLFSFPPKEGNPRNSEGAFLSLSENELIFVYRRFVVERCADHADCDLCLIRSTDNGDSWSEGEIIVTGKSEDCMNIMSVSLLHMNDGSIGLFYLIRHALTSNHLFLRRSYDGGRTWSERHCCFKQQGFFVVNNDRVIRLSTGRIVVPAAFHHTGYKVSPDEPRNDGFVESHSDAVFFYSDDDGETFTMSHKCMIPYTSSENAGLQEPGVVELSNGVLWGWARTGLGRQYEMFSLYGGTRWTLPQPSQFTSPLAPLSMKKTPNGDLLAVWNPIPFASGQTGSPYGHFTGRRTPLVAAVSHNDGETFSNPYPLEDDPHGGYCYIAVHFHGDAVLLAYCADGLVEVRCRRYPLDELTEKCDSAKEDLF